MKQYKLLPIITGLFVAVLIISNILDAKVFQLFDFGFMALGSLTMPAGVLIFPLGYVFGDILTEVYGYAASRKVIWTGFASLMLFIVFSWLAIQLPAGDGWNLSHEYNTILGHMPRIMTASMIAYFAGEFVNSFVLAKMKLWQRGKSMAGRFFVSTLFGQLFDTGVFVLIAFAGVLPTYTLVSVFLSAWLFKVLWETIALPVSVPFVRWVKRIENEDYFDKKTNFNPFRI
ncbi:MAG: queuosine precursor transporter [Rickettsiales bacterium]|jgi:uncharacterized integral membrane protein (TIGR00697 family)|nr:queuosine precursor transporter [Rickettsiales bacterium]